MSSPSRSGRPFFSIITCTYNRAQLLPRALDSLLRQECTDWECLIMDDASTDNTPEVAEAYAGERFRYIRHSHRGCAGSKNGGMEAALGAYVTFLDSDDEYAPGHLSLRKRLLLEDPAIDLLYSDVQVIGHPFVPDKNDPSRDIAIADCVVGGTFVIKTEALEAQDRFRDIYSDDSAFLESFAAKGRKISFIRSPTYIYHRDTEGSMCSLPGEG
jgi:glycosyltransferase involved in cell wall biosynthesis